MCNGRPQGRALMERTSISAKKLGQMALMNEIIDILKNGDLSIKEATDILRKTMEYLLEGRVTVEPLQFPLSNLFQTEKNQMRCHLQKQVSPHSEDDR